MANYILRARANHTLNWAGREYGDGDKISISKADAERIALDSRSYRFEEANGGGEISMASIDAATAPKNAAGATMSGSLSTSSPQKP